MPVMTKQTAKNLAQMSNGTYDTGKGQAFDDYLWDTLLVPSAPREMQFFKTGIGSAYGTVAGDAKTSIETSMDDNGKLPSGQSFLINAITVSLVSNVVVASDTGAVGATALSIVNAYRIIMTHSTWELKFTNTEYSWRDSGSIFLPSIFEQGSSSDATNNLSNVQIGQFFHYNWIKVSTKVPISELVSFSVQANFNSGSAAIKTKVNNAFLYLQSQGVELRTQLKGMLLRQV
jgi:hypothetical protein